MKDGAGTCELARKLAGWIVGGSVLTTTNHPSSIA
jgi:hypothetical protein